MKIKTTLKSTTSHMILTALFLLGNLSCGDKKKTLFDDPQRCVLKELGEASDLAESKSLPNDTYVHVTGIANPKTLVWQDRETGHVFYVAKIMGTGGNLLYMQQMQPGEKPKILSDFKGTLTRWQDLKKTDSVPMAKALLSKWRFKINPDSTYVIRGRTMPDGCTKAQTK